MFCVYILRSGQTGRRYIGSCADFEDRLRRHNAGESLATKHGMPWTLVYREDLPTRAAAMARERFFKTGRGREQLDKIEQ
jgi:putative endonuclease